MSPVETTDAVWAWAPALSPWMILALALVAVAGVVVAALRLGRRSRRGVLSASLRILALVPLALALAGLSRARVDQHTLRRSVVMILDGSVSMGIREGGVARVDRMQAYLQRSGPALAELGGRADLRVVSTAAPDRALSLVDLAELPVPTALDTDYLGAIEARIEEDHPAAIVLLGDGADRAELGRAFDGAEEAGVRASTAGLTVPVYAVPLGGAVEGDLAVRIGAVAPFAFVRRPIELPVAVRSDSDGPGEVTVTLERDGERIAARTVPLAADGSGEVSFEITPDEVGYLTLEVSVPPAADDPIPGNDRDATTIRVIRDRTRVLQLAGHPSWDVRYLRRFLKTDPNVDLISFYILRDAPMFGAYRSAPISLIEFPHEQLFGEDLAGFDLVVLQNFALESLPGLFVGRNEYADNLDDFVRAGGALLVVGGDRSFGDAEPGPLDDMLPVDRGVAGSAPEGPARLVPTAAGLRHPVMGLAGDEEAVADAWSALAELSSYNAVGAPRDGAVVLATAGDGDRPALAVCQHGKGRVMTLASDGSWRWAIEGEGHAHTRFWHNAVRWLVRDESARRLEVRPHAENLRPGEEIRLVCRALTAEYAGRAGAALAVRVTDLSGVGTPVSLDGVADADGSWVVTVPAQPPGTYQVELTSASEPDRVARARFTVRGSHAELRSPAGRPELLRALAESTGGQLLDPDGAMEDLSLDGLTDREIRRRIADPAWDRWWWLLVAALPLALDWFLRRRWGA